MSEKDLKNTNAKCLPRLLGKITIKMIDDHLNPISGTTKDLENVKFFTVSTSHTIDKKNNKIFQIVLISSHQ